MGKKNNGYMIAVPDKKNPEIINYYHVNGPRFLYGKSIVEDFDEELEEKPKPKSEEEKVQEEIARKVKKILKEKNKKTSTRKKELEEQEESKPIKKAKKKISKPKKKKTKYYRYTVPKERGIFSRIINRMMYENEDYRDVEDYLYDNYEYIYEDLEQSKNSKTRKGQKLYKRVQAYEDAREDVSMKKAFISMKVAAVAGMLVATGLAGKLLIDQVNDIVNSGYVAMEKEKPTLENANEGQILYAENRLDRIDYDFKHLTRTELLDAIIRSGSKVSNITENRARAACKDYFNFSDQKLLEDILKESYEGDYAFFTEEKKLELNQLLYEMLDEEVKKWIRNPEKVAEIKARDAVKNSSEMEIG